MVENSSLNKKDFLGLQTIDGGIDLEKTSISAIVTDSMSVQNISLYNETSTIKTGSGSSCCCSDDSSNDCIEVTLVDLTVRIILKNNQVSGTLKGTLYLLTGTLTITGQIKATGSVFLSHSQSNQRTECVKSSTQYSTRSQILDAANKIMDAVDVKNELSSYMDKLENIITGKIRNKLF